MFCNSYEYFKSIRVGFQMQIKFKVWKSGKIIITTSNFAGQKNTDQKNVRISSFFLWKLKKQAENESKISFLNSNKKLRPKMLGQHFSLFYIWVYIFRTRWSDNVIFATIVQNFQRAKFQRHRISGPRDLGSYCPPSPRLVLPCNKKGRSTKGW